MLGSGRIVTRNRRHIKATRSTADHSLLMQPSAVSVTNPQDHSANTSARQQSRPIVSPGSVHADSPVIDSPGPAHVDSPDIGSPQENHSAGTSGTNSGMPNLLKRLLPHNKSGVSEQGPLRPRR